MVRISVLLTLSLSAFAEVEVTAELSEPRIQQSESVKLIVNVTAETGNQRTEEPTFTAPDFEGLYFCNPFQGENIKKHPKLFQQIKFYKFWN